MIVASKCPDNKPATAGVTQRPRMPAEMAYAQSAPGVMMNRNDTAQNAARTLRVTR